MYISHTILKTGELNMNNLTESQEFYKQIRENRLAVYSTPKRYFNRDGDNNSTFKMLFFTEAIIFILLLFSAGQALAQNAPDNLLMNANNVIEEPISNYATIYNSGKVFLNWTAKNEAADCIYLIERSTDAKDYLSVGIKEGIGTPLELFYSWIDETPPEGFAYYRVKKIAKDGTQYYSQVNAVINQGASYNPKVNYAQGTGLQRK